jgi:uncharacterized protein (DUF736 family)
VIRTLSLNIKARIVPTKSSQNEKAPDLRVLAGNNVEAWKRTSKENTVHHSVKLDDLSFRAPICANLVEVEGGHALVGSRWGSAMARLTVDLELDQVRVIVRDVDSRLDPVGFARLHGSSASVTSTGSTSPGQKTRSYSRFMVTSRRASWRRRP